MPGMSVEDGRKALSPAIHDFHRGTHCKDVDARHKAGHDDAA